MLTGPGRADRDRLAELFAERTAWAQDGAPQEPAEQTTVQVLLRALDLADLIHGARAFAATLAAEETDAWRRSWTKARFLFGNPANLTERTPARLIAPGGSIAWLGPFPDGRLPGLTRLLRPVTGAVPALPRRIDFPGPAGHGPQPFRELHVALRGLTLAEYLVHIHHTLAESVLLDRLRPEEPLRLIHRIDLDAEIIRADNGYARVHFARDDPQALRLYTWLSPAAPQVPEQPQAPEQPRTEDNTWTALNSPMPI